MAIVFLEMVAPTLFLPLLFSAAIGFATYAILVWSWNYLPEQIRVGAYLIIFLATGFAFYIAKSGYLPLALIHYIAYGMSFGNVLFAESISVMLTLDLSTLIVAGVFGYLFRNKMK